MKYRVVSLMTWLHLLTAFSCQAKISAKFSEKRAPTAQEKPTEGQEVGAEGRSVSDAFVITDRSPLVASAGSTVTLTGTGFKAGLRLAQESGNFAITPALTVHSDSRASFLVPTNVRFGWATLALTQGSASNRVSVIFDGGRTDYPVITAGADKICSGEKFYDSSGELTEGLKNCGGTAISLCNNDGEEACVTSSAFKAAKMSNFSGADVRSTVSIAGVNGSLSGATVLCFSDGETGCLANANFPAVDKVGVVTANASKIRDTVTIAGVTGTLANCSADGGTGCVAGVSFPAAKIDSANLHSGNIKRGITVGGVTGAFPSATYPVPRFSDSGSTATTQVAGGITTEFTSFITQLTQAGTFEFWDSSGVRRTGSGDADIINANVVSGVAFENLGVNGAAAIPGVWDVRLGTSVGATTGKLRLQCRNSVNPLVRATSPYQQVSTLNTTTGRFTINGHGWANLTQIRFSADTAPTGLTLETTSYYVCSSTTNDFLIQTSATCALSAVIPSTTGTTVRAFRWATGTSRTWDTIDDYNNSRLLSELQATWSASTQCGGVGTATDDSVWTDVTTAVGGAPSNCATDGSRCTMKDKISGLLWSKLQSTTVKWASALSLCENLAHNGLNSGWRVPTQKELMDAHEHGIFLSGTTNWITKANMDSGPFYSSTSQSNLPNNAVNLDPSSGDITYNSKTIAFMTVCVQ